MQALVFPDIGAKTIGSNTTGGSFSFPKIVAGDDVRLKLRLLETIAGERIISRREVSAMKLSVGKQDARPTSGSFQLKLGADPESAGVNTTAAIGFDSTPEAFAAALDALTDAALASKKPFQVAKRDDSWHIRAADDGAVDFSIADNALLPQSLVSIRDYQHDEATHYEVRLIQTVICEQTNWSAIVPDLPSVSVVQHGATESGVKRNTIQQVFFPPELAEGYSFRLKWGFRRTTGIVLPTDEEAIQSALDAILETGEAVKVSAGADRVLIEFLGDLAGTDVAALEIESIVTPSPDVVINLSTAADAMAKYMDSIANAASGITEFKLPLSLTLWLVDEQDEEDTEEVTFIQEVTFQKPVSMAAFSSAATLNPTKPLSRASYLPFTPSQVTETQRGYLLTGATALGDGAATEFQVDHNLGTRHVYVTLFDSAVDGQMLKHGTDYEVEIVSDNAIKITFAVAPDADAVVGGICTVASTNAFVDLEIEIGQVIGLESRLQAIEEAVDALQESAAVQSVGSRDAAAGTKLLEITLPKFVDAYPMKTSLLAAAQAAASLTNASTTQVAQQSSSGTTTTTTTTGTPQTAEINSIRDIPPAILPRDGDLLGAIHDAALEALPGTLPTPAAANKGKVYQNRTAAAVRLPGGGGRKGIDLKPGEMAASDGRRLFRVMNPTVDAARTFTVDAATNKVLLHQHGYSNDQKIFMFSTDTLPAGSGIAADTVLYVVNKTANDFQVSTTQGGSAIDITDTGTGTHYLHTAPLKTSYYPADFEREMFITHVNADALQVKKTAEWKFGIELAILNKKTQAPLISDKITRGQWRLVVEIGTPFAEDAPATADTNIKRITWQTTPLLDKTLFVTNDTPAVHTFGARIKRTAAALESASFTVEKNIYGLWTASAAEVATADFFLRARLTQWDVEDIDDAEGFVVLLGLDKVIEGDGGDMGKLIVK